MKVCRERNMGFAETGRKDEDEVELKLEV